MDNKINPLPEPIIDIINASAENAMLFFPVGLRNEIHFAIKTEDDVADLLSTKMPLRMLFESLPPENGLIVIRLNILLPDGSLYQTDTFFNPLYESHIEALQNLSVQDWTSIHVVKNKGGEYVATKRVNIKGTFILL